MGMDGCSDKRKGRNSEKTHLRIMNLRGSSPIIIGFLILLCLVPLINGQSSIPSEQDGFWYGGKTVAEGSVLIEAFLDPVCPDSRDSWPPLKRAVEQYGSSVRVVVHTFPLPYHDNAFASCQALHIVNDLNSSATYDLFEAFFNHQEMFYNSATSNVSRNGVVKKLVTFVANELGNSYHSAVDLGFSDSKSNHATRVAFKYGCLRGVYGTPFFFVNGFPLPDAGSPLSYQGWRNVLDPLFADEGGSWIM